MDQSQRDSQHTSRWAALDVFRGFTVLSLIVFNGFYGFSHAPWWISHAPANHYFFADAIAPMFLFAVGLAYPLSLKRRIARGNLWKAIAHALKRSMVLILFGTLGTILSLRDFHFHWGVLEMIGGSSVLALPCILFLKPRIRLAVGSSLSLAWLCFCMIAPQVSKLTSHYVMGGLIALPAWASIVIIGSSFGELAWDNEKGIQQLWLKELIAYIGISIPLALMLWHSGLPPNKELVNGIYVLLSTGITAALFFGCMSISDLKPMILLHPFGNNAIILYMVGGVLNQFLQIFLPTKLPLINLLPFSLLEIVATSSLAIILYRKKISIAI